MKYGLIYYKDTENVGDDILSYASKCFLPRVDYYIDREEMDVFVPNEDEAVATILNGWYLHHNYQFPPSPFIYPLFQGIHFSNDYMIFGDYSYLDGYATEYLKANVPVGCRDTTTLKLMQERGIESYFSGCLTLTLEPFSDVKKHHKIILTDVPNTVEEYVRALNLNQEIMCKTHLLKPEERGLDWTIREQRVEEYLKLYQGADLVITSRLHCALPSIALGTPVILIGKFDADYYDRLADFAKYCHCFDVEAVLAGKADSLLKNPESSEDIAEVRNKLINTTKAFVEQAENVKIDLPARKDYVNFYVRRTAHMKNGILKLLEMKIFLQQQCVQERQNVNRLLEISQKLMEENQKLIK